MLTEQHQMVFIGGLHRSGTSPFHRALCAHPEVSGFSGTGVPEDEGQHLQDVLPSGRAFGGPARFGYAEAAHLTEDHPLATVESADRLRAAWAPHWDASCRVLVEKSPPNLIRMRLLQALVPSARFVVVLRHPVVVSLATVKWRRTTRFARILDHWFHVHRIALADAPHVHDLRFVRYEDVTADPEAVFGSIAEWLGLSSPIDTTSIRRDGNERYAAEWARRRAHPLWQLPTRRLIERHRDEAARYGYRMDDLESVGEWSAEPR